MAKKEIFYQGLDAIPVIIEDTSLTSPDYFRITELPTQLNAGINVFKFKGNISLFPEGADVYVEILDANGMPVYYEVGIDLESDDQPAVVTIYVNRDTTPGNGSIIICSTLTQSIEGQILDPSEINLRWQVPIYIDVSKRNDAEIIFSSTPSVTVSSNYSQVSEIVYKNMLGTPGLYSKEQTQTVKFISGNSTYAPSATYYNNNDTPVIMLDDKYGTFNLYNSYRGFVTSSISAIINISSSYLGVVAPSTSSIKIIPQQYSSSVLSFTGSVLFAQSYSTPGTGSHIAYLKEPISYAINNSNDRYYPKSIWLNNIDVTYTLSKTPDNIFTFENKTQNTYNSVTVNFSNLTPLVGTVAKIRSYYKSSGVGEYIVLNETDITQYDTEFGFNTGSLSATFALPTTHKNEKIDFKFEFISPTGFVSKQFAEIKNTTFAGGNSYIGGDDNLVTGSLFVASSTGSGVEISGKNNAAMIRSIGYEGFAKAVAGTGRGGFVIYSGSVQPLLNSSEVYSGVGIELYANTSSYFRYTTANSGSLDIRTDQFFLGGNNQFISGSNGHIEISSSQFHLDVDGNVTMTGNVNANTGIFRDVSIIGTVTESTDPQYLPVSYNLESWFTSSADIALANSSYSSVVTKPLTTKRTGFDPFAVFSPIYLEKFKLGTFWWTGSVGGYTYDWETGTKNQFAARPFSASIMAVTGAQYISRDSSSVVFDQSIDSNYGAFGGYNGIPTSFKNWGSIVGYNGHEYNIDSAGNYQTGSIDSVIFNTFDPTNVPYGWPYTISILSEPIEVYNMDASNPTPISLQFQAKFINADGTIGSDWLHAYDGSGNAGDIMFDCRFTVDIYNANDELLLSDTRIQESVYEWIDFNIPLTSLLINNPSYFSPMFGHPYDAINIFRVKLSWQVIEHIPPNGWIVASRPKQVRITELRVVHLPTSIGLNTTAVKFADSYLASMAHGTAVHGNLIPVSDFDFDLGSAAINPKFDYTLIGQTGGVANKRWNNIFGKYISADDAISIGTGIVLQGTGSVASGYKSMATGVQSHAEGYETITGEKIYVTAQYWEGSYYYYGFTSLVDGDYFTTVSTDKVEANLLDSITLNFTNILTVGTGPSYLSYAPNPYMQRDTVRAVNSSIISASTGVPGEYYYATRFNLTYEDPNNPGTYIPYIEDIDSIIQLSNTALNETGKASHAEGYFTQAIGKGSHAEGYVAKSRGNYSHAEGGFTIAIGDYSHAEGNSTKAINDSSHAEGINTRTGTTKAYTSTYLSGSITFPAIYNNLSSKFPIGMEILMDDTEYVYLGTGKQVVTVTTGSWNGTNTIVTTFPPFDIYSPIVRIIPMIADDFYHSVGDINYERGAGSHAEGFDTQTLGYGSHAEGTGSIAVGINSHAEGIGTVSIGEYSHAEGNLARSKGVSSHAEGSGSNAFGFSSHAEGSNTYTFATGSHAEGNQTQAIGNYSHTEGYNTVTAKQISKNYYIVSGSYSVPGNLTTYFPSSCLFTDFNDNIIRTFQATATYSTGSNSTTIVFPAIKENITSYYVKNIIITSTKGNYSHAEGYQTVATGTGSHAEGHQSKAIGDKSHAEGYQTQAIGYGSHTEGGSTIASGSFSHAEGVGSVAFGPYSHAEGYSTYPIGLGSHAEGYGTKTSLSNVYQALYFSPDIPGDSYIQISGSYGNLSTQFKIGDSVYYEDFYQNITVVDIITNVVYSAPFNYIYVASDWSGNDPTYEGVIFNQSIPSLQWGGNTTYSNAFSHAEGFLTKAFGQGSHAEGAYTTAQGFGSHAEGWYSQAVADSSHAEGNNTIALGPYQHVSGIYNATSSYQGAFIHGNGSAALRSNLIFASGSTFQTTGSINIKSGSGDFYVHGHKQFNVGAFSSMMTLSGSSNVSQSLGFTSSDYTQGIYLMTNAGTLNAVSGSKFRCDNPGTYNIQFSAQLVCSTATSTIYIWLKVNGTNVPASTTKLYLKNNEAIVAAWNWVYNTTSANDYIEIAWQSDNGTGTRILYEAGASNYPAIPSVIATVTQVR